MSASRTALAALTAVAAALAAVPASSQVFVYEAPIYEAPPIYVYPEPYEEPVYVPGPPVRYYPAPVVRAPRRGTVEVVSPEDVEDNLERNGFTRLSPIEVTGNIYQLTATDPAGADVALTVSMLTGRIEEVRVLGEAPPTVGSLPRRQTAPRPQRAQPSVASVPRTRPRAIEAVPPSAPPAAAPAPAAPKAPSVPRDERDPLVVY